MFLSEITKPIAMHHNTASQQKSSSLNSQHFISTVIMTVTAYTTPTYQTIKYQLKAKIYQSNTAGNILSIHLKYKSYSQIDMEPVVLQSRKSKLTSKELTAEEFAFSLTNGNKCTTSKYYDIPKTKHFNDWLLQSEWCGSLYLTNVLLNTLLKAHFTPFLPYMQ